MVVTGPRTRRRQGQAGQHAPAAHQHGAGAALAMIAAFLAAGQVQMLAQCIQQGGARVERQGVAFAINIQQVTEHVCRPRRALARLRLSATALPAAIVSSTERRVMVGMSPVVICPAGKRG